MPSFFVNLRTVFFPKLLSISVLTLSVEIPIEVSPSDKIVSSRSDSIPAWSTSSSCCLINSACSIFSFVSTGGFTLPFTLPFTFGVCFFTAILKFLSALLSNSSAKSSTSLSEPRSSNCSCFISCKSSL